jgi:hypothetical protein
LSPWARGPSNGSDARALGADRAIEAHMRISAVAERLVQIIASRHRLAVLLPAPE